MVRKDSPGTSLNGASILAVLWGIVMLLGALSFGIPPVTYEGEEAPVAGFVVSGIMILFAVSLLLTGYFLRKRRRPAGIAAFIVSGILVLLFVFTSGELSIIGVVVNTVIIILTAVNWNRLQ